MSKESARAFIQKIRSDEALAKEITSLGGRLTDQDMARIASDAGFECSVEELDEVGREAASELSDADLAGVAGGTGGGTYSSAYKVQVGPGGEKSIIVQTGTGSSQLKAGTGVQNLAYTAAGTSGTGGSKL